MYVCEFPNNLPFLMTKTQGWSNRKSLKELHSGSTCGSRQRHVGLKKGNAWSVRRAAWHFVTVTVEQATERKRIFQFIINSSLRYLLWIWKTKLSWSYTWIIFVFFLSSRIIYLFSSELQRVILLERWVKNGN